MRSQLVRSALILLVMVAALQAQENYRKYYYYRVTTGANETLTVQQPASGAREQTFEGFIVSSGTACTAALEKNGTAAANALAIGKKLNTKADAPKSEVYVASDVGAGEVVHSYDVSASSPRSVGKSGLSLAPSSTQQNFSVRTTCPSGSKVTLMWSEN